MKGEPEEPRNQNTIQQEVIPVGHYREDGDLDEAHGGKGSFRKSLPSKGRLLSGPVSQVYNPSTVEAVSSGPARAIE